ncbi:hypothetical protein V2J09_007717 [Rumex salicifolius]
MASSSTNSPCAACKFLRRKCQPECVFAPYFPPDQPQKFANVHKVFGASNVTKLLNELLPHQREDAVNSLAYEADMRLRDPVYGCVGVISLLQHQLRQLQMDLTCAKSELSKYQQNLSALTGAHAFIAAAHHHQNLGINLLGGGGGGSGRGDHHFHHQLFPGGGGGASQNLGLIRSFDAAAAAAAHGGSCESAGLLAMNMSAGGAAGIGGQIQQPRAAAGDDRWTTVYKLEFSQETNTKRGILIRGRYQLWVI